MNRLTKSRYLKGRQCHRRIWLAVHGEVEPALESEEVWEERGAEGAELESQVATLFPNAVRIVDAPGEEEQGELSSDLDVCIEWTRDALSGSAPILQAHLAANDLLAIADLLEPRDDGWFLWEIKASTRAKVIHHWDLAFQCEVARRAGLRIVGSGVIHLNREYRRGEDLDVRAMILAPDLTEQVTELREPVKQQIAEQLAVMQEAEVPDATPGPRCKADSAGKGGDRPSACGHLAKGGYCGSRLPENWAGRLPSLGGKKVTFVQAMHEPSVERLDPDEAAPRWTEKQRRMIVAVQHGEAVVESDSLRRELGSLRWPVAYVDFEFDTMMAVPRYRNSRPYEPIPFQWSMQIQLEAGVELEEPRSFLHLDGDDPRQPFMDSFLAALPVVGSIVAHHKAAELTVLRATADSLGGSNTEIVDGLAGRFFDTEALLLAGYYHPEQQGSYLIKKAAPALLGSGYGDLEIQDGIAAVVAWKRAVSPDCSTEERAAIEEQLLAYCGRDTQLMYDIVEKIRELIS